jgi:hypothetical protein
LLVDIYGPSSLRVEGLTEIFKYIRESRPAPSGHYAEFRHLKSLAASFIFALLVNDPIGLQTTSTVDLDVCSRPVGPACNPGHQGELVINQHKAFTYVGRKFLKLEGNLIGL